MPFSLSAKPPKPKPKKPKDKVVVRSSGRGGSGNIKRKQVPKTPPSGADLVSVGSHPGTVMSPLPMNDAASSKFSTGGRSKATNSSNDGAEAEDRINAPVGREILTARHRVRPPLETPKIIESEVGQNIYSGRGGSGNAHKLVADESVYQGVLLHEQGILQAYTEQRRERAARSTGRGGSGNIRKKKSANSGSETSSTRTRSSGRSWGSIARRYRHAAGASTTVSTSDLSLSPIPSLTTLPNNDFGNSLSSSILDKGIFEKVEEEDESQFAGPSQSSHATTSEGVKTSESGERHETPIKFVVTNDTDTAASPVSSSTQTRAQAPRSPASKPISPSAIASGSWIANRLQEPVFNGGVYRSPSPNASTYSMNSSVSSLIGRAASVPLGKSSTGLVDGSQPSESLPPMTDFTVSPSSTPNQSLSIRRAGSANALSMPQQEMTEDAQGSLRARSLTNPNRNASVYAPQNLKSSTPVQEDLVAPRATYSVDPSYLPYLARPIHAPPVPPLRNPYSTPPPTRPLPPSPSASKTLDLPRSQSRSDRQHSREMSSSTTSGSDLDLSRYNFPEAPGHQPTVLPREIQPASLHMVVERNGEVMMAQLPPRPKQIAPLPQQSQATIPSSSSPPRTPSRAPVLPGAYQAALRSALEAEVPDGPPPLYQPRASRRYHTDLSQDQDYPEPATPTANSPYRVASPTAKAPSRLLDTSNATIRPSQRAAGPASPLSEVYSTAEGSPTEKYPPEVRPNEKAYYSMQRSGSGTGRRPSDPYHRLLSAAAKTPTPPLSPASRRGSSSNQGLSPSSAMSPHPFNSDGPDPSYDYSSSDLRSRPPSQAFSTYTRGTRHSTWGASQATATAVDHHEFDFPQDDDDDGIFYTSMLADLDGNENERGRMFKDAMLVRGLKSSTSGKEPLRSYAFPSPPLPQMPRHLVVAKHHGPSEPALSPPSRQLPTPPLAPAATPATPAPAPAHPLFPEGMGWDELNRPAPRKLSRMEKALLRRVEFGPNITAADVAAIPLT